MKNILDFLQQNWVIILPVIEALLRVIPTKKNVSIIDNAVKVINFFLKNRRVPDVDDEVIPDGKQNVNRIVVDRNKHII